MKQTVREKLELFVERLSWRIIALDAERLEAKDRDDYISALRLASRKDEADAIFIELNKILKS